MMPDLPEGARLPKLWEAVFSLLSLTVGIGVSIVLYGLDPQVPMLLGVIAASLIGVRAGFKWHDIEQGMVRGISNALPAIMILLVVGILIGVWILAGVVPTLIYYGLTVLSPSVFLPATLVICSISSLATGSSWGTAGTIGVALMGVGAGLGFPLPIVAGAVLSGAYFGDKMSPLSDTTNLAPAMAGTDLFTHIRHMTYTTGVTITLTLLIEIGLGLHYSATAVDLTRIQTILSTLEQNFTISPILLLPPVLVMLVSYRKLPAIPGITVGILAGALCGVIFQGADFAHLMTVSFNGFSASTGVEDVDSLLSRGGMQSMLYTVSIILVAMMFGGVMERTGQIRVVALHILSRAKSTGSLILSTVLTAVGANLVLCDQYMSIVISGRSYADAYRARGLAPQNLSRAIEDSGTVTSVLVPWNSCGAYQATTLGVATLAYLPFTFFCWLSPLVTVLFGYMGWTITPLAKDEAEPVAAEGAEPVAEEA
ncbi:MULTISPECIES: Na+/H+ antiporter NhaC [Thioclava]|uniref:Na+/H+ antiporter NhaC n=1 Tax=Thioclava litoralis TaxID=3076557 RepID=A0ABZ1E4C9_9RHOB|nr:Na+/H+ antiporter NhaC [Thioclava sp. FTW29]